MLPASCGRGGTANTAVFKTVAPEGLVGSTPTVRTAILTLFWTALLTRTNEFLRFVRLTGQFRIPVKPRSRMSFNTRQRVDALFA